MSGGGISESELLPNPDSCKIPDCLEWRYNMFDYCLRHIQYRLKLLDELKNMGLFEIDKFKVIYRIAKQNIGDDIT